MPAVEPDLEDAARLRRLAGEGAGLVRGEAGRLLHEHRQARVQAVPGRVEEIRGFDQDECRVQLLLGEHRVVGGVGPPDGELLRQV